MIRDEWNNHIKQALIEALEYPLLAVPEFWAKRQKESGVNKQYFFRRMYDVINEYLHIHSSLMARVKKGVSNIENAELSLNKFTNGSIDTCKTLSYKSTSKLDEELLLDLKFLLSRAIHYNDKQPAYSHLQIISFAESALRYIHKQFQIQCGLKPLPYFTYDIPKSYQELKWKNKEVYLLFHYNVLEPTPVFEYYQFEEALRSLLLNSSTPESLKQICKSLHDLGGKIAELWNNKLEPLAGELDDNKVIHSEHYIAYYCESRSFANIVDERRKHYESFKPLPNYSLALFAVRIVNLIAREVLNEPELPEPVDNNRTRQIIIDELNSIDKAKGWQYAFEYESEYNSFVNLLTNYFEYKPYSLPDKKIKLLRGCKTRLAKALHPIHEKLCNENISRKSDAKFFEIVRVLSHFKDMNDTAIYELMNK